jgi:uncharacterized protein YdhG (YjbR/CyaY superfamily)
MDPVKAKVKAPNTIGAYLANCPPPARTALEQIRQAVRHAAPRVEERISYKMPAFYVDGHAVLHAGAYKKHIGLYPAPSAEGPFAAAVAKYGAHKSTLQLPLDEPMPLPLIRKLVRARVKENRDRDKAARAKLKK